MASATDIRTKEEIIEKCVSIHGNKYDYSKIEYVNNRTKMCIICPEHGEFWQNYKNHVTLGKGCPICGRKKLWEVRHQSMTPKIKREKEKYKKCFKMTFDIFIKRAKEIHNNKYDYSKVKFVDSGTKVCIICPEHGEFWQKPINHLQGHGCPKCANVHHYNTEEWIEEAKKVHGDKYNYSKVEYVNSKTKVCIICPEHGEFWQVPSLHLMNRKCPKCALEDKANIFSKTTEEFIEDARKIHSNCYDYSKVEYVNNRTKVCIICPEHGEFWQTPCMHLRGDGCPKCSSSYLERELRNFLKNNTITFEEQKTFDWLRYKLPLKLDFYLPDYNVAIECQGKQHFKPINYFGGKKEFQNIIVRDKQKFELCTENNVNIIYYTKENINKDYFSFIVTDLNDLKNYLNKLI